MISCVIHTFNSALYLEEVLLSVKFCDELIIVDMHSDDETISIAERHGAKIVYHENIGYADPARQFGLENCSSEWVLALDSDELIPSALAQELSSIANANEVDVVHISRVNYLFGREIYGSGWGYKDEVIPRFFRAGFLTYGNEVHDFIKINPKARNFRLVDREKSIIHFNCDSVSEFIRKLDRYTDLEILKQSDKKSPLISMMRIIIREFFGRFIFYRGYKDGWIGLYLGLAMAFYRSTVIAKRALPKKSCVVEQYKVYAKSIVSGTAHFDLNSKCSTHSSRNI